MDVANHATLPTNLVSYWELEEASGTRVDSHGSNDLTDNNTVTSATGLQGDAADFTKANSEDLSISDASQTGLDFGATDFSFAGWINLDSLPSVSGRMGILGKSESTDNQRNYAFLITDTDVARLLTYQYGTTATYVQETADSATFVSDDIGSWVHIAVTFDISSRTTVIYKNGSSVASTRITGGTLTSLFAASTAPFELGDFNSGSEIDAQMDEWGVWTKVLTQSEIDDLYNSGSGIPYDAGGATGFNSARRHFMMGM